MSNTGPKNQNQPKSVLDLILEKLISLDTKVSALDTKVSAVETKVSALETKVSALETKVSALDTKVTQLQDFQVMESRAIEYELRKVLITYLSNMYPTKKITQFEMKELKDPATGRVITEFDGAFGLSSFVPRPDMKRIAEAGLPWITKSPDIDSRPEIFVLAEAKHYIHRGKIAKKLGQLDAIMKLFDAAKAYSRDKTLAREYSPKFMRMVERQSSLTNIHSFILFFCASFWDEDMMERFERDIQNRKDLVRDFFVAHENEKRIRIFRTLKELEKRWYVHPDIPDQLPPDYDLSDEDVLRLDAIRGAMEHVQCILPSGNRYIVHKPTQEVSPVGSLPVGGKRRTRRCSLSR